MQKSKLYLEAAKGNFANTNNNQTVPIRPTLEQGLVVNEGVPTAESPTALEVMLTAESPVKNKGVSIDESPTALEVVPTAESPITKEDVPTYETPTEVVGEPTAESPTPRKCCDEWAIFRNARNLLVASGHIEHEGDERQVNSLSPSHINIQKYRRVIFSVDPVNEGAQSSTSVPPGKESLGNIMDVDLFSRPHYEPIDMTIFGLRRSKHQKSENKKCYSTIKNIGFTAYCAFDAMITVVRGQIAKISASREIQNVEQAHSNVDWTRNICQPISLITAMISKDTLTYGDMKLQPEKPQFITEIQKEISDHEHR